jgi:hypothetical protein
LVYILVYKAVGKTLTQAPSFIATYESSASDRDQATQGVGSRSALQREQRVPCIYDDKLNMCHGSKNDWTAIHGLFMAMLGKLNWARSLNLVYGTDH